MTPPTMPHEHGTARAENQETLGQRLLLPQRAPVTDTTGDSAWSPVQVTARLAEPVVGLAEQPALLDGPASWGAFVRSQEAGLVLPPYSEDEALDFRLPLATWTAPLPEAAQCDPKSLTTDGEMWGWACSRAIYTADAYTATATRKRPATEEMARFTPDRRLHRGLGPFKARIDTEPAVLTREITWYALAVPDELQALLNRVTHLGRKTRHGNGRVLTWAMARRASARTRWKDRPWPGDVPVSVRAPHHHPTRRVQVRGRRRRTQ